MNNSQSSDFFSDKTNTSLNDIAMDIDSYCSLVCSTKKALQSSIQTATVRANFTSFFSTLLEDCKSCISQSLELINNILSNSNADQDKLIEYINDSVSLLQMLSDFVKTVVETISLSCCNIKTFPTVTGHILMMVFLHCKESESLYGAYLRNVAKYLKDLFRTCHELQLTYLMVMEKHFVFDLTEQQQLDILDAALEINLEIGEIVEILDVKTTAEQWKAFTAICEKYRDGLTDKPIFNDCTKVLCQIIEKNINIALEPNQDKKIIVRSLKVSSFMIKILLKICNIFKHNTVKQHNHILELLLYIYFNSHNDLENNVQFMSLWHANVLCPSEVFLNELLNDISFVNLIFNYDLDKISQEYKLFGFIILLLFVMKAEINNNEEKHTAFKNKIVNIVYDFLPYCHIWFNIGYKFTSENAHYRTEGLYEYLLIHMVALASVFNSEGYDNLQRNMIKALLNTECVSALFSANLWILLARLQSSELSKDQLISLCKVYKKCEDNILFENSLQKVHLSYTITGIFEVLKTEDKLKIYNEYSSCEKYTSLLCLMEIKNLPKYLISSMEEMACKKLIAQFEKIAAESVNMEELNTLIYYMKWVASCSIKNDNDLSEWTLKAWMQICLTNNIILEGELENCNQWFFQYVRTLASLTNSLRQDFFERGANIVKVMHVLQNMAESGNVEFKLVLIDFFFHLITQEVNNKYRKKFDYLSVKTFKCLLETNDYVIRNKLLSSLRAFKHNKKLDNIVAIVNGEDKTKQIWDTITEQSFKHNKCKEKLAKAVHYVYTHKCIQNGKKIEANETGSVSKYSSGNFDLADGIDTLFENESASEPVCKKPKFCSDASEADVIITQLENGVSRLGEVKDSVLTVEQKTRIRDLCDKLINIIN